MTYSECVNGRKYERISKDNQNRGITYYVRGKGENECGTFRNNIK
ncbi:hypothetical protein [Bacillus thuringiensis]|nr:hypothetical protein [Bacillus thuringiensis]